MRGKTLSYFLVMLQFASLAAFALTGPWLASVPWLLAVEFGGLLLGVWALLSVGRGNLYILPDVRAGATFVRRGPYRFIRHPMYAALLLVGAALTLDQPSPMRLAALALLLAVILVKLHYEERLLGAAFPEYARYKQETSRLIPFVY